MLISWPTFFWICIMAVEIVIIAAVWDYRREIKRLRDDIKKLEKDKE